MARPKDLGPVCSVIKAWGVVSVMAACTDFGGYTASSPSFSSTHFSMARAWSVASLTLNISESLKMTERAPPRLLPTNDVTSDTFYVEGFFITLKGLPSSSMRGLLPELDRSGVTIFTFTLTRVAVPICGGRLWGACGDSIQLWEARLPSVDQRSSACLRDNVTLDCAEEVFKAFPFAFSSFKPCKLRA